MPASDSYRPPGLEIRDASRDARVLIAVGAGQDRARDFESWYATPPGTKILFATKSQLTIMTSSVAVEHVVEDRVLHLDRFGNLLDRLEGDGTGEVGIDHRWKGALFRNRFRGSDAPRVAGR